MEPVIIHEIEKVAPRSAILIEGLPGVGNVGKLAAAHLIDELKTQKIYELYSKHFPPQVLIDEEGVVKLVSNEIHYYRAPKKEQDDILILTGEYQGLTPEGQYELCDIILGLAQDLNVKRVYTLGGYGLGKMVPKPRVLGAGTNAKVVQEMTEAGVEFSKDEPGSGIVGASGLLLGMGILRGMEGGCLMGETSGYLVDPKSAQVVLEVIQKLLNLKLDITQLEEKAQQMDLLASHLKDMESQFTGEDTKGDHLSYIG